ncbi:MAG: N-acyl homoserine lactonase family protein [Thermomicrobiales bacterium]|nr:N-acyl homoserine lactonase family protein [Thermomicrobiales bacterium]
MATQVQSLTVLDLGRANIDMGTVMAPGDLDGVWAVCAFPGYLVELTDGRHILIDTGPNRRHIREPMYEYVGTSFGDHLIPQLTDADDIRNRLAELSLTPADIDILVLTHNHFDHAGNVADFADSEIIMHRADHAVGIERGQNGLPGGIPAHADDGRALRYTLIDDDTELAPGFTLVHTPGHSPGHLSIGLDLPDTGSVILAIDAIYSATNRELGNYRIGSDPAAGARSATRLIDRATRTNALLIYGHDPSNGHHSAKAPQKYTLTAHPEPFVRTAFSAVRRHEATPPHRMCTCSPSAVRAQTFRADRTRPVHREATPPRRMPTPPRRT